MKRGVPGEFRDRMPEMRFRTPGNIEHLNAAEPTSWEMGLWLKRNTVKSIEDANGRLAQLVKQGGGKMPPAPKETPLEQAQEIAYKAFDLSGKKRVALARKALEVSPDCADAHVLLAIETSKGFDDAIVKFTAGVEAGKRALGESYILENTGHFWSAVETRPLMRGMMGLACVLQRAGRKKEAIAIFREMLHLNPDDSMGVRYILVTCLLEAGEDEAARKLIEYNREDDAAIFLYCKVLVVFRREGPSRRSARELRRALEANVMVVPYLTNPKSLPKRLPGETGRGDRDEAIWVAHQCGESWRLTPGALDWLMPEAQKQLATMGKELGL